MLSLLLVAASLAAEPVLPDYTDEIVVAAWTTIDAEITEACVWPRNSRGVGIPLRCDEEDLDAAIAHAEQFSRQVVADGRVFHLIGLAHRHAGRVREAERALRRAVELSPDRPGPWLDLGELLAGRGAWDEADAAFAEVTRLLPDGPLAWSGWFQRAQAAAHRGDAPALERHLKQALRHGFTFRMVAGSDTWRAFWRDEALHPTLERLVTVYAEPSVREALEAP